MVNVLRRKMESLAGRAESGRWLFVATEDPVTNTIEVMDLQEPGGRLNPPNSFPTAYLSEDNEACRARICEWIRTEMPQDKSFVILTLDMQLIKILDLGEAATRRRLGISLAEVSSSASTPLSQALGAAAHRANFEGIIYPRPLGKGKSARNLALFCDRTSPLQVSMAGTSHVVP